MFDEQWQFAVEVERKYNQYRKKVMVRYDLSAAEVDVILFLSNKSHFDLAVVNKLCEKGYIQKETDAADRKKVHLKLEESASEIIRFGQDCQRAFGESLFSGISREDREEFLRLCELIRRNVTEK